MQQCTKATLKEQSWVMYTTEPGVQENVPSVSEVLQRVSTTSVLPLRVFKPWTPPLHMFAFALNRLKKKKAGGQMNLPHTELLQWMLCFVHCPVWLPWLRKRKKKKTGFCLTKETWKNVRSWWKHSPLGNIRWMSLKFNWTADALTRLTLN